MRMPVCVFEKNDGHSPAPNGHPPVRTGQQFCPNRSRWPKKAETGFFSAFAPPKTILYNIYHTAGPLQNGPAGSRSAPHPSAPAAGALPSFRTRKHRKHCLDFSPAKGSGRSHAPAEFLLLKHVEPYAPKDSASFLLPASFPLLKTPLNRMRQRDSAFFPPPASFPLLKTPPHRMRRGIQLSSRCRQVSHC